jgi:CysZ protein
MSASDTEWIRAILAAVSWILWLLAVLVIVAANAILLLLMGQAVASPFLDMLSEKVEELSAGTVTAPFSVGRTAKSIALALADVVWSLGYLVAFNIPVFLIGVLIPVVGTSFSAVATFVFTALVLSVEFVTMPAARAMVPYRRRFGMVWRNKWIALGFGTAAMGVMLVPGLNLILLPLASVGGTLAYCDLQAAGRLETKKNQDLSEAPETAA